MEQVAAEAGDGEGGAVAAPAAALPLRPLHGVERVGQRGGGVAQLHRDGGGILLEVALLDRGRVLVPIRVQRVVLDQHEREPLLVEHADVAHVAGVLERRPAIVGGAPSQPGPGCSQDVAPTRRRWRAGAGRRTRAARADASNPHSGHGRRSTQVQSLSSGTIGTSRRPVAVEPGQQVGRGHGRDTVAVVGQLVRGQERPAVARPARRKKAAGSFSTPRVPSGALRRARAWRRRWRRARARANAPRPRGSRAGRRSGAWCRRGR